MCGGYFRQRFYARKRRAERALTFPPCVPCRHLARCGSSSWRHRGSTPAGSASFGPKRRFVDAHRQKSPRAAPRRRQNPRGKFAACKSEVVACSVTCFLFSVASQIFFFLSDGSC